MKEQSQSAKDGEPRDLPAQPADRPECLRRQHTKPIRTLTVGVALAAATPLVGTMALAANGATATPPALKGDVSQGQAEQANDQVGTNIATAVAKGQVNSATEADNNGANEQVGEQLETGETVNVEAGDKGAAGDGNKQEPPSQDSNRKGNSSSDGEHGRDANN